MSGSDNCGSLRLLPTILLLTAVLLWGPAFTPIPSQASPQHQGDMPARNPATLLIGYEPAASLEEVTARLAQEGLYIARVWPALNLVEAQLVLPTAAADQAAAATTTAQANLATSPLLRYITYDVQVEIAQLPTSPTDPRVDEQWALAATNVAAGWTVTQGDERVAIALLDTGYAMNHEDLPHARLWVNEAEANGLPDTDDDGNGLIDDINGWDWVENDPIPDDEHGHGTHVSGVIAAGINNGIGIAGHGRNLRIAPLRVLDGTGTGFISDLVAALDYARIQGFPIINLSLTVQIDSPALHDAIKAAHAAGSMVVAATGNKDGGVQWPALYPETVAVAATSSNNSRWAFSNYGPTVDLAAPGAGILSTYIDRPSCATPCTAYSTQTGTSMSTPHVSALAGLILSVRPDFTLTDTLTLMQQSAADLNADSYFGTDIYLGAGAIDYHTALISASLPLSLTNPVEPPLVIQTGSLVNIPMQVDLVQGGEQWAIAGAAISYTLAMTDGTAVSTPAVAVTDQSGAATLSVMAPITDGIYIVHSTVGAVTRTVPLTIRNLPITTTLTVAALTTTVGSPAVPFTVTIDDPEGILEDVVLPLRLTTDLGSFDGDGTASTGTGSNTSDGTEKLIQLSTPVYTGTLQPGTMAGSTILSAAIGNISDAMIVEILPGAPAILGSPLGNEPPLVIASEETTLSFKVTDIYSNAVADGTTVVFTTTVGSVNPVEAATTNGCVTTKLTIPANVPGPVVITATVAMTDLAYRLEIPLIQNHFMPLIRSTP